MLSKKEMTEYKKVYDNRGKVAGFVKPKSKPYPHFDISQLLNSAEAHIKRIEFQGGGDGYLDNNGNVFTSSEIYVGNLKNPKRIFAPISVAFILLIFITLTTFYSTVTMGKAGFPTAPMEYPEISITNEDDSEWTQELDILENSFGEKLLFPGANGQYGFVVENKTDTAMSYNVILTEINTDNIPIKYRLKANNIYVAGSKDSWVAMEEIDVNDIYLPRFSSVIYQIEWKWPIDENDQSDSGIGNQEYSEYVIDLTVNAQFIYD